MFKFKYYSNKSCKMNVKASRIFGVPLRLSSVHQPILGTKTLFDFQLKIEFLILILVCYSTFGLFFFFFFFKKYHVMILKYILFH